jgi:MFS family permease
MPPDPILVVRALIVTAAVAGGLAVAAATGASWLFQRPWRAAHYMLAAIGGTLGVGVGTYLGCWWLEFLPQWKLGEIESRFLYLLIPAILVVEMVAAFPYLPRWSAWGLRILLAGAAPRLLLHGSTYLADSASADTNEWTPAQTYLLLGGLAAALLTVWAALVYLMRRTGDRCTPLALSGVCAGAAVTIMFGYLTGGELGLPLAAALAGAGLAALVLPRRGQETGVLGVGVVGLFGLVILGRFFGNLTNTHAALLFAAPLLCWLPELPGVRRIWPWLRGMLRVALVLIPVALVAMQAHQQFEEDSKSSSNSEEPTVEDYMNFKP